MTNFDKVEKLNKAFIDLLITNGIEVFAPMNFSTTINGYFYIEVAVSRKTNKKLSILDVVELVNRHGLVLIYYDYKSVDVFGDESQIIVVKEVDKNNN